MSRLLLLVVHHLVSKVLFDGAVDLLCLLLVMSMKQLTCWSVVMCMCCVVRQVMMYQMLSLDHITVCVVMVW